MIKFGTDGWRAILGEEFNKDNVEVVTLAIAKYIYSKHKFGQKILVGYDPRNKAEEYAKFCAKILAEKGFKVTVSSKTVPTPVLAYNAKLYNSSAIMFTASHNPANYLGMKYIPEYAGPATSDITQAITENFGNYEISQAYEYYDVEEKDFSTEYYKQLEKLIDFEKIRTLKTNIIFDGLYSASIGYFDELLEKHNIKFSSIHMRHDINFGGMNPDPKPVQLQELMIKVKENCNSIGLANDGDADRFGVVDEAGNYVSPNLIMAILLKYLVKKGYTGAVVTTVGSGLIIDRIAQDMGVEVIETAVGFKYVGEAMRKNRVIIGGEESGGLSIYGHIPEKDGLLANLLVLEAVADSGKTLVELEREICEKYGYFYTDRNDYKKSDKNEISEILESYKTRKNIGNYNVTDIDTKDGVKLMFGNETKILIRPSGTEPLLRVYFESSNLDVMKSLEQEIYNELKA